MEISGTLRAGALLALTLLSACAVYTEIPPPQLAYDDKAVAHAGTAVIMADPGSPEALTTIKAVNGRRMSCFVQGCPLWVRVLPGPTKITVEARFVSDFDTRDVELTVDAQPLHTYLIVSRVDKSSKTLDAGIVDGGVDYQGAYVVRDRKFSPTFD